MFLFLFGIVLFRPASVGFVFLVLQTARVGAAVGLLPVTAAAHYAASWGIPAVRNTNEIECARLGAGKL